MGDVADVVRMVQQSGQKVKHARVRWGPYDSTVSTAVMAVVVFDGTGHVRRDLCAT